MFVKSEKYDQSNGRLGEGTEYFDLTLEDFARSFGTTVQDIPDECRELIGRTDFRIALSQ